MIRRRPTKVERPADWTISTSCQINGRNVEVGTELSIKGERGRFTFHELVEAPKETWLTCYPVGDQSCGARSFRLEKVKTVHVKKKGRG